MLLPVRHLRVLSIGEVLWDIFGGSRHLGGAPFNFAYHCSAFRTYTEVVTRVGNDQAGQDIVERACELGVSPRLITVDTEHPTGTVTVTVDSAGVPSYIIHENVAWDYLELTHNAYELAPTADIVCFGTLAQRSPVSRRAIQTLLDQARPEALRVYDINLRQQYYSETLIRESLSRSNLLKLNEDELAVISQIFGFPSDTDFAVRQLIQQFDLKCVVVTRGANGAAAWTADERVDAPTVKIEVRDTVGSGDAFTAVFSMQLAAGAKLEQALRWANAAGAYVATQPGATPDIGERDIAPFLLR